LGIIRELIMYALEASDGTKGAHITPVDLGGRISENKAGSSLDRETWRSYLQHAAVGLGERLGSGCGSSR
jgi:hypothetical protein